MYTLLSEGIYFMALYRNFMTNIIFPCMAQHDKYIIMINITLNPMLIFSIQKKIIMAIY